MYASNLLHKKRRKKATRRRRSSGGGGCCPVIRVKCSRKHGATVAAAPTIQERLARFKKAKKAFARATGLSGSGPIHPEHESTSLPKAVITKVAHAAANPAQRCTVTMGNRRYKGMTGAQAQAKITTLMREQRAKRCMPLVQRG